MTDTCLRQAPTWLLRLCFLLLQLLVWEPYYLSNWTKRINWTSCLIVSGISSNLSLSVVFSFIRPVLPWLAFMSSSSELVVPGHWTARYSWLDCCQSRYTSWYKRQLDFGRENLFLTQYFEHSPSGSETKHEEWSHRVSRARPSPCWKHIDEKFTYATLEPRAGCRNRGVDHGHAPFWLLMPLHHLELVTWELLSYYLMIWGLCSCSSGRNGDAVKRFSGGCVWQWTSFLQWPVRDSIQRLETSNWSPSL